MATQKEQTLKVNDFLGISRYYNSPNQPPNKLFTLQNMYSPVKGELALVGGVTKISGAGMPGVTEIKHVDFLKTAIGYERLLVFFDHAALPTPSAPTAAAVAGTQFTGTKYVAISYVGMGGESTMSAETTVACGAGANIEVTLPTLPDGIVAINVFVAEDDGGSPDSFWLHGVAAKRSGVTFPSSITLNVARKLTALTNKWDHRFAVEDFTVTFDTLGTLESGKTYFFGIMPFFAGANTVTTNCGQATMPSVLNASGRIFSFTVPEGFSSATVSFGSASARSVAEARADTAPYEWTLNTTDQNIPVWVFMGTTPNDMMAVSGSTNGIILPQANASETSIDTVSIYELPYNSNFSTFKQQQRTPFTNQDFSDIYNFISCRANNAGTFTLVENQNDGFSDLDVSGLGIYALPGTTFDADTAYQIMPTRGCGYYSKNNTYLGGIGSFSSVFVPESAGQFRIEDGILKSASYINRLYYVNGIQTPFSTNGYVLSQVPRKALSPFIPITTEITLFNERLILGGGENTLFNTQNVIYYSASADPESWTGTPGATAALQFVSALEADADVVKGFGIYSDSLSNAGIAQFLIIGKERSIYTWNGNTAAGAQLVSAETGFASSNAFCLSTQGPVFVGRENVYLMTAGGRVRDIGNDVSPILKALSDANIETVYTHFHAGQVKIGYRDTANIDRELWLDLREDRGQMFPIFTGPHVMKAYSGVAATNSFASVRDFRVSYLGTDLFKRDDFSSYLNDTVNIAVFIESNDIGFGAEEFAKIITQFYLRAKIKKAETITMGITVYDSSSQGKGLDYSTDNAQQTYSPIMDLPYGGSGTIYRNFQKQFPSRYRGDMLRFSLALSTNVDFRVQAMNWLFNIDRRRLL